MNTKELAVIFDMDGVLMDTAPSIKASFNELLKPHGLSMELLEDSEGEGFRGNSLKHILGVIKDKHGLDFEVKDFSKRAGAIAFRLMEKDGVHTDPTLVNFLETLQENKIAVGIGTSSLKWRVGKILKKLGIEKYFSVIVSAEDVREHKPNPHLFLEVARQLNVEPKNCVVIEDARSGLEAAHRAGMKAIAFTAYNSNPKLISEADHSVSSFSQVDVDLIKRLLEES